MTGSDGPGENRQGRPAHEPAHDGASNSTEARLRRALTTEAAMVQPAGDSLQKVRDRIEERRGRAWWQHPAVALVAAAALGIAASGLYFGLRDDGGGVVATQEDSPSPDETAPASPSTPQSPSASASPSSTEDATRGTAFVYYIHDDGQSPRLYRETQPAPGAHASAAGAVQLMLDGAPKDPDYASPWPAGAKLLNYAKEGDKATVDVSTFVSVGAELETAAVQELVYTVTANDTSVQQVRLLVDGKAPQGHRDWSDAVARAPMVDVQGLVWLLSPTQGETVSSPVKIEGFGTAFEGTISWEVRQDGKVVKDGVTSGGSNGEFDEFSDSVELPPGDYEVSAFESSAEDGSPIHVDTKSITVN